MGYTHYWKQKGTVSQEDWKTFTDGVGRLIQLAERQGVKLVYEYDETDKPPLISTVEVRFNGAGAEGHETFIVERRGDHGSFCKTTRKPYDVACVAILCYLASYHGDIYEVGSDGHHGNWQAGLALARAAWPELLINMPPELRDPHPLEIEDMRTQQERAARADQYRDGALF